MILQQKDKWGRWNIFGAGILRGRKNAIPIREKVTTRGYPKITFTINTAVIRTVIRKKEEDNYVLMDKDNKEAWDYVNVNCAVYGNKKDGNDILYTIASNLKIGDRVLFGGVIYTMTAVDEVTGREIPYDECKIDWLEILGNNDFETLKIKPDKEVRRAVKRKNRSKDLLPF